MAAVAIRKTVQVAIDTLRKGAASLLLVTPVARLVVAGAMLGLRGEWRYTLYAAGVLGLLAIAVGAGISARVVALIAPAPFLPCDMTSAGARLPAEVYVICGLQAGAGHTTVIFAFAPLASVMALGLCAKSGVTL